MADAYDRGRTLAIRMLTSRSKGGKGLKLTISKTVDGEYDPETGEAGQTVVEYSGSGFRQVYDIKVVDGQLIQRDDVQIIVSPVQLSGEDMPAPVHGDAITFDGTKYGVESVAPWNFAGLDLGFVVQARK